MATIGFDCDIMLDSVGYFIKPGTYQMKIPRIRKMTTRADGGLSYIDMGPGKRTWSFVVLCLNDLQRYDGGVTGLTGQDYRDALRAAYDSATGSSLLYIDPLDLAAIPVHFDHYEERVLNIHGQQVMLATGGTPGLAYEVEIALVEA